MEVNPYAAPQAPVNDVVPDTSGSNEYLNASRGRRLGAALLDGLMVLAAFLPAFFWGFSSALRSSTSGKVPGWCGVAMLLILCIVAAINCALLSMYGQTIGKRMLGIKVIRTDGDEVSLGRFIFLRFLPVGLLGRIPLVGPIVTLVDCLMIFGAERRCLHDVFADTIVVYVKD
ncbi:MAG TPA: RDD family protein [Dyella sp.]|uniref:RDD family protein n=1 Tax=Dyella sp. TaxID=1869338 RepID=UPI002F943D75